MSEVIAVIPDHKLAAQEIKAAYTALGLRAHVTGGDAVVSDAGGWQHRAFNVNIVNPRTSHFANFTWRQGTGVAGTPRGADVLANVCREYADSDMSFEDWAGSYGYDKDSRAAEKIFNQCRESGANLLHLGLTREQIQKFADMAARL